MIRFLILLAFPTLMWGNLLAAEAGMPQLDPEYWASQAFWLVITFSTIYILIAKIFIPKIKSNLDMREDKIRKNLEEAKLFKEKSEEKLKEYKDIISKGKIEVKKILAASRQKLNEDMLAKKIEIQKKIEKETIEAEKEINKFKNESVVKLSQISVGITSDIIKDIFGDDLNKSSVEATVNQSIKDLKGKNL
tara:strand:- start:613 stop:1188 length:576 start_codon:yes stop_codon:yes gene_type:complete